MPFKTHNKVIMLLAGLLASTLVAAEREQVGAVYEIEERDALEEIQERASAFDHDSYVRSTPRSEWTALRGAALPRAHSDKERTVTPSVQARFDVVNEKGEVIYPKGFAFNPLEHITLPQRVVILDDSDIDWLLPQVKDTDIVVVTTGDYQRVGKAIGRPAFLLEAAMIEQLHIRAVPTIVEQVGNSYQIREFFVDDVAVDG